MGGGGGRWGARGIDFWECQNCLLLLREFGNYIIFFVVQNREMMKL